MGTAAAWSRGVEARKMPKRWTPPPAAPSKPRMDCTLQEHLQNIKEKEKPKNSALAQWEKANTDPDQDHDGPVMTAAQKAAPAGPAMVKDKKKKKKDKEKSKKNKKDKSKKEKKKGKKK